MCDVANRGVGVGERVGQQRGLPATAAGEQGRFPAHVPSGERALPCVSVEQPDGGGGGGLVDRRHLGLWLAGALGQVLRGPVECLVEVTQVAGVGTTGLEGGRHVGRLDRVTADRFEQPVRCVRHVAVVTVAAGGIGGVASVRGDIVGHFLVALQASLIAAHAVGELVVRIALVHGVAT